MRESPFPSEVHMWHSTSVYNDAIFLPQMYISIFFYHVHIWEFKSGRYVFLKS